MHLRFLIGLSVVALVAACSDDSTSTTTSGTTSTSTTATGGGGSGGGGAGGGGAPPTVFGGDRPVELHVPDSYDPTTPAPLLILLHGYSANGMVQDLYFGMQPVANDHGILYAFPDGTIDAGDNHFWNATDACCDFGNTGVDDSGYLSQLVSDISAAYNVDDKRIYFIGHSNGGFMSHRMACDHAGTVAAIASLAGAVAADSADCTPSEPVNVLQIHGTADDTILYDGGDVNGAAYPSAPESVLFWAGVAGCDTNSATDGGTLDLDTGLAGEETDITQYTTGCAAGGSAELWTINGGGHIPDLDPGFAEAVVQYLLAHPKP